MLNSENGTTNWEEPALRRHRTDADSRSRTNDGDGEIDAHLPPACLPRNATAIRRARIASVTGAGVRCFAPAAPQYQSEGLSLFAGDEQGKRPHDTRSGGACALPEQAALPFDLSASYFRSLTHQRMTGDGYDR